MLANLPVIFSVGSTPAFRLSDFRMLGIVSWCISSHNGERRLWTAFTPIGYGEPIVCRTIQIKEEVLHAPDYPTV